MIIQIVNMTSKDLKWPQNTSNDLKRPQKSELVKPDSVANRITNKKSNMRRGSMHEIREINEEYLDEIFHNNNFQMEIAMQIFSND